MTMADTRSAAWTIARNANSAWHVGYTISSALGECTDEHVTQLRELGLTVDVDAVYRLAKKQFAEMRKEYRLYGIK